MEYELEQHINRSRSFGFSYFVNNIDASKKGIIIFIDEVQIYTIKYDVKKSLSEIQRSVKIERYVVVPSDNTKIIRSLVTLSVGNDKELLDKIINLLISKSEVKDEIETVISALEMLGENGQQTKRMQEMIQILKQEVKDHMYKYLNEAQTFGVSVYKCKGLIGHTGLVLWCDGVIRYILDFGMSMEIDGGSFPMCSSISSRSFNFGSFKPSSARNSSNTCNECTSKLNLNVCDELKLKKLAISIEIPDFQIDCNGNNTLYQQIITTLSETFNGGSYNLITRNCRHHVLVCYNAILNIIEGEDTLSDIEKHSILTKLKGSVANITRIIDEDANKFLSVAVAALGPFAGSSLSV